MSLHLHCCKVNSGQLSFGNLLHNLMRRGLPCYVCVSFLLEHVSLPFHICLPPLLKIWSFTDRCPGSFSYKRLLVLKWKTSAIRVLGEVDLLCELRFELKNPRFIPKVLCLEQTRVWDPHTWPTGLNLWDTWYNRERADLKVRVLLTVHKICGVVQSLSMEQHQRRDMDSWYHSFDSKDSRFYLSAYLDVWLTMVNLQSRLSFKE